ncbi:3-methyladenine DNA glycosylase [Enemella dayhoffiae]|uniref:3-methyladenine DNA glycosylase n=1 Tax=Enemella dayhoffiae TaxID=2016507 RepID=UPI001E496065|nr:3-methyladenine DNA glycosylase [Enemella dayhoffiae]
MNAGPEELTGDQWRTRRAAHQARVDQLLADHRWRSSRAIKHPVEDFLFEYYPFRPYQLRRWSPGHGVRLLEADELLELPHVATDGAGVRVHTEDLLAHRARTVRAAYALLRATTDRAAGFGCFGMHEWAMVAGLAADEVRHPQLGLRLPMAGIEQTLESVGLRCTHVDAHRFFSPAWKPRNRYAPTRANQVELDQPGCLHVGMDLYRIAGKLSPLIESELVVDCFELAREIRVLDMRASPYDLGSLGLTAIAVETATGRAEYVEQQRAFTTRARPLRARLLERAGALLSLLAEPAGTAEGSQRT